MVRENEIMEALVRSEERARGDRALFQRMNDSLETLVSLMDRGDEPEHSDAVSRNELIRWLAGAVVLASLGTKALDLLAQLVLRSHGG